MPSSSSPSNKLLESVAIWYLDEVFAKIGGHGVWLYHRFFLSLRDVERKRERQMRGLKSVGHAQQCPWKCPYILSR